MWALKGAVALLCGLGPPGDRMHFVVMDNRYQDVLWRGIQRMVCSGAYSVWLRSDIHGRFGGVCT